MTTPVEVGLFAKYGSTLITVVGALIGGKWFWSWKSNKDKEQIELRQSIKKISDLQIEHDNRFASKDFVRTEIERNNKYIVQSIESIEKISKSTQEAVVELTTQLREKTAVDKALEEYRKQQGG